ncbi:MAG: DciA family protein [Devosia sp.]
MADPSKTKAPGKPSTKAEAEPRRLNRAVAVSEALGHVLDAALKKRGFATRDILTHWATIAPKPYDAVAVPAELKWPRGAGHEGATLFVRAAPGHALAIAHQGPLIAQAVNRYFGYFLVRDVRLSAEPMVAATPPKPKRGVADSASQAMAAEAVGGVADDALKGALGQLGAAVLGRKTRPPE